MPRHSSSAVDARQAASGRNRVSQRSNSSALLTPPRSAARDSGYLTANHEDEADSSDDNESLPAHITSAMLQQRALELLSVFEPDGLFIHEAAMAPSAQAQNDSSPNSSPRRSPASEMYFDTMQHLTRRIQTPSDLQELQQRLLRPDKVWVTQVTMRIRSVLDDVAARYYQCEIDALRVLDVLPRITQACTHLLWYYLEAAGVEAMVLLVLVIRMVLSEDRDVRTAQTTSRFYAGGETNFEYNLYRRFINDEKATEWLINTFATITGDYHEGTIYLLQPYRQGLVELVNQLQARHQDASPEDPEYLFMERFRILVARIPSA